MRSLQCGGGGQIFQYDDSDDDDTDDSGAIYSEEYRGIPYAMIVEELADQLGGAPEHGYRILARRGAVIAFRKACMLFIMNGKKWSRDIEDFCRWSFDYDMWVKMSLYSESLNEDMEMEKQMARGGMSNNLDLLPDEFTREECCSMRTRLGKKNPNPKDQLGKWMQRGFIIFDEVSKKYHKTQKYLSSHAA